jgi:hypothetical protein
MGPSGEFSFKWSHGFCGKVPWLLWPAHLIVITPTMLSNFGMENFQMLSALTFSSQ